MSSSTLPGFKRPRRIAPKIRLATKNMLDFNILTLVLPYLPLNSSILAVSRANSECRTLVQTFLKSLREIKLDGRCNPLVFRSGTSLATFLLHHVNPARVEKLHIVSAQVSLESTEEDANEWGLTRADEKTRTFPFPLGIFPHFSSLKELRVESSSLLVRHERRPQLLGTAPLQIALANLHELGSGACPLLEVLSCAHVEVDDSSVVTDVWGPDCTPSCSRKLRAGCPRLRVLGVLSSPGPRMLREIRRTMSREEGRLANQSEEFQEAFRNSFLTELARFQSPMELYISVTTATTPGASARSTMLRFRDEAQQAVGGPGLLLGEFADCLELVPSFPVSTTLNILVRATGHRYEHMQTPATQKENTDVSVLREGLVQHNAHVWHFPSGDGALDFLVSPPLHIVHPTRAAAAPRPSSSFVVQASAEPRPKRSYTDISQDSLPVRRTLSMLEPDDEIPAMRNLHQQPGAIVRSMSMPLDDEEDEFI